MRTPRANFIIEYKTSRRQPKAKPTSIWGDLDLRAVARAVERDKAIPEFELPHTAAVTEDVDIPKAGAEGSDVQAHTGLSTLEPSAKEEMEEVAAPDTSIDKRLSLQQRPSSTRLRVPRVRPGPQRSGTVGRLIGIDHRNGPSAQDGSDEELASLEAENRHLRRLLVARLREENDRLKFMLGRFGGG